jgi:hypothetical protein
MARFVIRMPTAAYPILIAAVAATKASPATRTKGCVCPTLNAVERAPIVSGAFSHSWERLIVASRIANRLQVVQIQHNKALIAVAVAFRASYVIFKRGAACLNVGNAQMVSCAR